MTSPEKLNRAQLIMRLVAVLCATSALCGCFASRKPPAPDPAKARRCIEAGLVKLEEGMPQAALEEFNDAVLFDPNSAEALYQRGNAYVDLGDPRSAVENYGTAIFLAPTYVNAVFNRAMAYASLGAYKNAVRDLLQVVQMAPDDREAHRNLGVLYDHYFQGERSKSIASYRKYLELGGRDPDVVTRIQEIESAPSALTPEQIEALQRQVQEMEKNPIKRR